MRFPTILAVTFLAFPTHSTESSHPVVIETNGEVDACALGQVSGVRTFLAVRSGPDTTYDQVDTLHNGDFVLSCDGAGSSSWVGVVFNHRDEVPGDCGISSSAMGMHPYRGPCLSGWVRAKWITVVAD